MRALVAAGASAAAWSVPALAPIAPPVAAALGLPRRLPAGSLGAALTFDDGPHPGGTPAVLETLRSRGARATFFLVGEQVERHPALAAEIAAAGHAVALHGHRHRLLLRVGPRALADDLDRGAAAIGEATGVAPALYRPPYGIFSPAALALVRRRGWRPLLWSRWGHDWRRRITPQAIAAEVTEDLGDGDVLLLHDADHYSARDSWRRTAAALPLVLDALAARGLQAALAV
jgi:peptidoglycan/xylan/chitin deacetylase (PgdA/CDA1 family)